MPSTRARGVSSSMIQALEERRRNTSQIKPEIAARSPEPAKRCAPPHSFSAFAAGTRSLSIVSMSSMAAESRAAGVMRCLQSKKMHFRSQENLEREIYPHDENHQHAGKPRQRAIIQIVGGHENPGMHEARHHENPRQGHDHEVGMAQRQRQRDQHVEQDWQLELVLEAVADLGDAHRPVLLPQYDIPDPGFLADQRISTLERHPDKEGESEPDQDKDGKQNHPNRH